MGFQDCRRCGKQVDEGESFCPQCRELYGPRKPRRLWVFSLVFSGLLLSLAGLLLWHGPFPLPGFSASGSGDRQVAVVNGESVRETEFEGRLQRVRAMLERQYGEDVFSGTRGGSLLQDLKAEVLEGMMGERLLAQECRRMGIEVRGDSVEGELQRITAEVFGSPENFQRHLEKAGIQRQDLEERVRLSLLAEAVKKEKFGSNGDPGEAFNAWLAQVRRDARVEVSPSFAKAGLYSPGRGGCCGQGSGAGGCGIHSRQGSQSDPSAAKDAEKAALEAFRKSHPGEKEVTAKVTDYGCHIQVDIQKEGRVLKSYSYQNGKVEEGS